MKIYDLHKPLIFIHIPKTAGTSILKIFDQWFGNGLLLHYYKEMACEMPMHHDILVRHSETQPVVVYGHFNRRRNFGVEDYYPQVSQFVTILRDPLERLISNYFYLKEVARSWAKYPESFDADLENYVSNNRSVMLNYFPREVTFNNYKDIIEEFFIEIGIVEEIDYSMSRIAKALERPFFSEMLERLNVTNRDQSISDNLRSIFIEKNELEYCVYNYVRNKFYNNLHIS